MGAAIKKCTSEIITKLKEMGYSDGTWIQYKDMPFEKMSLATYVGNAFTQSCSFNYYIVPTEYCFHKNPSVNWIQNRAVFDDEDVFLAYAAAEKFHICMEYLYKHCWFIDRDGLYKQCETARPNKEEFPMDWWRVATPEDIIKTFESWKKIHEKNSLSPKNPV